MNRLFEAEVFVRVVEDGSLTAAARRLEMTTSYVSKLVTRLEARLGARLLIRTTRKLSLTETGRAYFERCTEAIRGLEEAEQLAADLQQAPRGTLRLTVPSAFGSLFAMGVLAEFKARFPELSLELVFLDRQVDLIGEGFDAMPPRRDDRLPGGGLLRRRRPCYPDRMQPFELGVALRQELERGAVAAATLDEVVALLDGAAQPDRAAFLEPLFCAMPAQKAEQLSAIREHLEARPLGRVALLDVLLTWTRLEQPLVASVVASLVTRDEATATATLRKLAASLAAPYPDHFWDKPWGLRPRMPLYAVVQACRRDERAAVAAAADAVPGPWRWNAEELEQAASSLALDNDAASVRELMQRAVVLAPGSARCWYLLGTALTQLRDDGEALPALVRATELGDEGAWYNRACVHMRHGQVDAAIAALARAVASEPELRVDAIGDDDFATVLDHPEFLALIES